MARAILAAAVPTLLAAHAAALTLTTPKQAVIPGTDVPMPADYEDYTRGRKPWRLFKGDAPGKRAAKEPAGPGLPAFDPTDRSKTPEAFIDASPDDEVGRRCSPGGNAAGHYFYNVWDPELVPFIVDRQRPDFKNASVIVAPGGGNVHLAWEPEGIAAAEWLNGIGISAFVLKYRVPFDKPLIDAQRAVVLVRGRAHEYGLSPERIGMMGSSAGGALAIDTATHAELQYPPEDEFDRLSPLPDFALLLYPGVSMDALMGKGIQHMPPTFLAYARNDPCCPVMMTASFGKLLKSRSPAPVETVEFAEGKHGWGSCEYYPQLKGLPNCHWHESAEKFIRENVLEK